MLDKIIPVKGDVMLLGLGLSTDDLQVMCNVSVVFHVAASVRFDDPLKDAILLNTRGSREVFRFGQSLKNLSVIMHVSTTYSNPDRYEIEEMVTGLQRSRQTFKPTPLSLADLPAVRRLAGNDPNRGTI